MPPSGWTWGIVTLKLHRMDIKIIDGLLIYINRLNSIQCLSFRRLIKSNEIRRNTTSNFSSPTHSRSLAFSSSLKWKEILTTNEKKCRMRKGNQNRGRKRSCTLTNIQPNGYSAAERWLNAGEGSRRLRWYGNAKAEMTKIVKDKTETRADESLHLVLHESVADAR